MRDAYVNLMATRYTGSDNLVVQPGSAPHEGTLRRLMVPI